MRTVLEISKDQADTLTELHNVKVTYETENTRLQKKLKELATEVDMTISGFNKDKIDLGFSCVDVYIRINIDAYGVAYSSSFGNPEAVSATEDAIKDVISGCTYLKEGYICCKSYSRAAEREDHNYGMGPKWGSIIFSIGLKSQYRKGKTELSAEQLEAILYVLQGLRTNTEFRKIVFGLPK